MGRLLIMVIPLAVIVYAFIDVLMTPAHRTKQGPKWLWAVAVLLLPIVGAVLWFLLGRPPRRRGGAAGSGMSAPDDDLDFLRDIATRTQRPDDDASPPASAA